MEQCADRVTITAGGIIHDLMLQYVGFTCRLVRPGPPELQPR